MRYMAFFPHISKTYTLRHPNTCLPQHSSSTQISGFHYLGLIFRTSGRGAAHVQRMEDNDEEPEGGLREGQAAATLSPRLVSSLVISPSKSLARPSPRVLSPIRKPPVASPGDYRDRDRDTQQAHQRDMLYEGHLGEPQDMYIHSSAVVKSSEVEFPVHFHELQSNTDLKMPPSNWLQDHSSIRLANPTHRHSDFSSFVMAHQFPDCIGEVDVVSDAENIKKLLKIPFNSKAHVSMMIHRVGKTLLIDDFDIYKYLLRQSEKEWQWLRKFFFENVLQSLSHTEAVLVRPNKSRNVVQSRSLLSKFLYHSVNEETRPPSPPPRPVTESPVSVRRPSVISCDMMPEPTREEQLPQASSQTYTRTVVWNFEDLHLLIGTDLPIFGGGNHPCVSLRLRDMSKPINIITGIDYWLDNLMCNVPEVIMCYHLDGIVQKYELIKTEDLPHMCENQFSPTLVRDVAQNILAFLNSKATKEGHTYWLFKGKDDDIVKLYDLTSLCLEDHICVDGQEDEAQTPPPPQDSGNPFTVPVAMLFYRVAKNMRASEDANKKIASIRALLKNSLTLLDKAKYPKIVSSAHYMLSDLYLPQDIDPDSPVLSDCSDEDSEWSSVHGSDDEDFCEESESQSVTPSNPSSTIKLSSLCKPHITKTQSHIYKAPPLLGTLEERCLTALSHICEALDCLHSSQAEENDGQSKAGSESPSSSSFVNQSRSPGQSQEQEEPKMARPFHPIPMPYSPLSPHGGSEDRDKALVVSGSESPQKAELTVSVLSHQYCVSSWWDKLHILLLRKASLVYLVMARSSFSAKRYGLALRYSRFSTHAWHGMVCRLGLQIGDIPLTCQALTLAGDIFYLVSKAWDEVATHIDEYNYVCSVHGRILTLLDHILPAQECIGTIKMPCDVEEALTLSLACFEKALLVADPKVQMLLARRLGNVCNELGVMHMNQAGKLCERDLYKGAEELWQKSSEVLRRGMESFTKVGDVSNMALLRSNTGRLMRLCAFHCVPKDAPRQFVNRERNYYEQALKEYQKALEVLKSKKKNEAIWELVVWEYGTTLFTMASLLQDHPPTHPQALKYCDVKTPGARQPLYQYRAAVVYKRLASIYYNSVR
ncbi:Erythroid differentiation-related factor 1 [Chionoecetes opilio]|uniref:Erythroid differentiation-related factor 1 n=1 Tax=Chionoecetes opilio TaxID=41210 RepID=A0A8J4YH10_CHIOP|nr:Erythroid differentiation-related factor 1 [Chionoecetes opilio]